MEIKVCGPGCDNCDKAEKAVHEVLPQTGVRATVGKITDFAEMARLGVLTTSAIVIDGVIKCVGKGPSQKEILLCL